MRFEGRVAIVTGTAGGIGSATARALAREGAELCLGREIKSRRIHAPGSIGTIIRGISRRSSAMQ
jgi:NAD(P)-dependent dehydrogenase (short-subunit alcohol dehydrogenase family)